MSYSPVSPDTSFIIIPIKRVSDFTHYIDSESIHCASDITISSTKFVMSDPSVCYIAMYSMGIHIRQFGSAVLTYEDALYFDENKARVNFIVESNDIKLLSKIKILL